MSLNTKPFVRLRDAVGFNVTALRLFFLLQIKISLALAVLVSEVNQTSHFSWNEPKQTTLTHTLILFKTCVLLFCIYICVSQFQ